jgi:hypothetical protein
VLVLDIRQAGSVQGTFDSTPGAAKILAGSKRSFRARSKRIFDGRGIRRQPDPGSRSARITPYFDAPDSGRTTTMKMETEQIQSRNCELAS